MAKKYNILIVDDEEDIRDILSFIVPSIFDSDVELASNGLEAIDKISSSDFDIVICDYNMPQKNGGDVYQHLISLDKATRYVMCSSDLPEQHEAFTNRKNFYGHILKPDVVKSAKVFAEKLKNEIGGAETPSGHDYTPISLNLLFRLSIMPSDIFIKLSDHNYVVAFKKGSLFEEQDYVKFAERKIHRFYALNFDSQKIIDLIVSSIIKLNNMQTDKSALEKNVQVHGLILSTFKDYGIQESLTPYIELQLKETLSLCRREKNLSDFLEKLLNSKDSYITKHSFLLSSITVAIAFKMEWVSPLTSQKLVFSALFHDVFLSEAVSFESSLNLLKNHDPDFLNHSQKAADLLSRMPIIPPDTARIILEHHELGEDCGFPKATSIANISPLSQLFNFSHFLVDTILEMHGKGWSEEEFYNRAEQFSKKSKQFQKIYKVFRKSDIFSFKSTIN